MLKGGDTGPAFVPGKPDESPLIEAIRYEGDVQMPPKKKLKAEEIAALTDWVKQGAYWPEPRPGVGPRAVRNSIRVGYAAVKVGAVSAACEGSIVLVVPAGIRPVAAAGQGSRVAAFGDRSVHSSQAREKRSDAGTPCRQGDADSPRFLRLDWAATHARAKSSRF